MHNLLHFAATLQLFGYPHKKQLMDAAKRNKT
jgi:hypothetical protein